MASIRDNAEERKAEREATSRRPKTNDDRGVAIYHLVPPHEGFEESACTLFGLVRRAQTVKPGRTRTLLLDIGGHRDADGGFEADMLVELQNAFLVGFKTTTSPPSRSSRIARGNVHSGSHRDPFHVTQPRNDPLRRVLRAGPMPCR